MVFPFGKNEVCIFTVHPKVGIQNKSHRKHRFNTYYSNLKIKINSNLSIFTAQKGANMVK